MSAKSNANSGAEGVVHPPTGSGGKEVDQLRWHHVASAVFDSDFRRIIIIDGHGDVRFHTIKSPEEFALLKSAIAASAFYLKATETPASTDGAAPESAKYVELSPGHARQPLLAITQPLHLNGEFLQIFKFTDADRTSDGANRIGRAYRLTARETNILLLLADGMNAGEITGTLGVSLPTVRTHIQNVFKKLGIRNQQQAVKLVITAAYL